MNYSVVKWIGTILIIGLGLFVALKFTHRWQVAEDKVYRLSLTGNNFELSDGKTLRVDLSLVFKTEKEANFVSEKQNELNYDVNNYLKQMPSSRFVSQNEIENSRYELIEKLKNKGYKIEFLTFDSNPVVFEY